MINKTIESAINEQINAEMYSAYLYLAMSAYFEEQNLSGFANWMRIQAQEEMSHAMKFYDYIIERGGRVDLKPIEGPPTEWKDTMTVMQEVYEHEQKVTSLIYNLVKLAKDAQDYATENMLQWYVAEQVEEEANADAIIQKLIFIDGKGHGLLMIDKELQQRQFVDETKNAE